MPEGNIGIVEREKRAAIAKAAAASKRRRRLADSAAKRADAKRKPAVVPTYSTTPGKGAGKKFAATKAHVEAVHKLHEAGFHKQARQVAAGLPVSRGFTERVGKDFSEAATGFPGGVYQIGKAVALDTRDLASLDSKKHRRPFGRTAGIGKAIGKQYYHDYRHPIRYAREHPGFVGLDISAIASAGAGTAARAGAAGRALEEGGIRAAAKAAIKRPPPATRVHHFEGQPIRGRHSLNPAAAFLERQADKARERKGAPLTGKPSPSGRLSTIGATKAERLLSEERRVTSAAAKAPGQRALSVAPRHQTTINLLNRFGVRKGGTVEDAAIRVAAEGVPLDDVIAAHRTAALQLEDRIRNKRRGGVPGGGVTKQQTMRLGGYRKELLRRAAIYEQARKYLETDVNGEPVISAKHPELQARYEITKAASLTREERAKKIGLLSLQSAERRKQAPGEMMRRTVAGGRAVKIERPRTLEEAKARAAELEARLDKGLNAMARDIAPDFIPLKGGKPASRQVSEPEKGSYRKGQYGRRTRKDLQVQGDVVEPGAQRGAVRPRGTFEQARAYIEDKILTEAAKPGAHPVYKRIAADMQELADLSRGLQAHAEYGTFAEGMTTGSLGKTTEFKGLSEMEPFTAGKFRVPDVQRSKRLPHGPLAYRGGVPRKPGTLTHEYTGALRRTGEYTPHTIRAVAEDALDFERYADAERFRSRLLPMGQKVRPPDHGRAVYVPLRERNLRRGEAHKLRKMLEGVDPEILTPDEATAIDDRLRAFEQDLFPMEDSVGKGLRPNAELAGTRVGEAVPGVVWVDRRLLGSQRKLIGRLPVIDETSDVVKGLILYAKPGYVAPNVLGNIGYNLFQQGFLAPLNWNRAVRMPRDLDFMVKEIMGSGYSHALAEGTVSKASFAVRKAGDFWSHFVDDPFRKAAFIHEARRYGFKTSDAMRSLILDPQHRALLGEIAQRARDSIVDYERMGPVERDLVRRIIFIYPWVKGSTYYAAQFLRDHPIQAAVFARIGQYGQSKALEELGPLPAWAQGSFKVGGTEKEPRIVNPQAVSPFSTPAQVFGYGKSLVEPTERSQQIGEATNPVLQAAYEAATGRDTFTGKELHHGLAGNFLQQIGKGLPQYLLYKRGGLNFVPGLPDQHVPEGATYPYTPSDARKQFIFGSAYPRPANRAKLNDQAAGPVSAVDRVHQEERDVLAGIRQHAPDEFTPELRRTVHRAYGWKMARDQVIHQAKMTAGAGDPYQREVTRREADLLLSRGKIDAQEAATIKRIAATGKIEAVAAVRTELHGVFDELYLAPLREVKQAAGVK